MQPVEQSMNLTSYQKAEAYLYGSMASSGGPFFPKVARSMMFFYVNKLQDVAKVPALWIIL